MFINRRTALSMAAYGLLRPSLAQAALPLGYPARPITLVVPYGAGGTIDIMARLLAVQLQQRLGVSVIVDNKPGAGGVIGTDFVARGAPDGYTFLFTAQSPLVILPFVIKNLQYDPKTAFSPVALVSANSNVLVTSPDSPFKAVKELIAYSKTAPSGVSYGSQGIGTSGHVGAALISQKLGLGLRHVPYSQVGQLFNDVIYGRVNLLLTDTLNVIPRIRAGKLIPLALASIKRSSALPDVPTFAELGYSGLVSEPWYGIVAPSGTPAEIRDFLAREVMASLTVPKVIERLRELDTEIKTLQPAEFGAFLKEEYVAWREKLNEAGIRPE